MKKPRTVTTNGSMPASTRRIAALLAHHEGIVHALRTTLAVLRTSDQHAAKDRHTTTVAAALAIDAARRGAPVPKPPKPPKPPGSGSRAAVLARRQRTAALLDTFSTTEPHPLKGRGRGAMPLLTHGYLKRVKGGYIRTAKPFDVGRVRP